MGGDKFTLCSHKSKFVSDHFYRAKPVSSMERSGIELHCVAGDNLRNAHAPIREAGSST